MERYFIPWWAKLGAKLLLSRSPFGYEVWQWFGIFRHGRMDSSSYAVQVFDEHVARAELTARLHGKRILELGPGDSVATALVAAAHGARAILVDTDRYARPDPKPYIELWRHLVERGLSPPDIRNCSNIYEILNTCGAEYMPSGLGSLKQVVSESVDFIFSHAVLEHVRKREFFEVLSECYRVLAPQGQCSHQVDLRDHLAGALNNLRFSEQMWESEFISNSGFYTNRLSCNEMIELFRMVGFHVEVTGLTRWKTLPTPKRKFAREFLGLPDDERIVSGFSVRLHK